MDRLNDIGYPAIDYEEYFDAMDIPKEDKEKRIELAERMDDAFFWLFAYISFLMSAGEAIDTESLVLSVRYRMSDLVRGDVRYVPGHIAKVAKETVQATLDHMDDRYFTSDQRATEIAASEAHTYFEYEELQDAWDNGKTRKTWHTQGDRRVRKTHREVNGKTIRIEELFEVGGSYLAVPKDTENGCDLKEVSNCRCWVTFS